MIATNVKKRKLSDGWYRHSCVKCKATMTAPYKTVYSHACAPGYGAWIPKV